MSDVHVHLSDSLGDVEKSMSARAAVAAILVGSDVLTPEEARALLEADAETGLPEGNYLLHGDVSYRDNLRGVPTTTPQRGGGVPLDLDADRRALVGKSSGDADWLDNMVSLAGTHTPEQIAEMVRIGLESGKLDRAQCQKDLVALSRWLDEQEIAKGIRHGVADSATFAAIVLNDREAQAVAKMMQRPATTIADVIEKARHDVRDPGGRFTTTPARQRQHAEGDHSGAEATDRHAAYEPDESPSFTRPERSSDSRPFTTHAEGDHATASGKPARKTIIPWRHGGRPIGPFTKD